MDWDLIGAIFFSLLIILLCFCVKHTCENERNNELNRIHEMINQEEHLNEIQNEIRIHHLVIPPRYEDIHNEDNIIFTLPNTVVNRSPPPSYTSYV